MRFNKFLLYFLPIILFSTPINITRSTITPPSYVKRYNTQLKNLTETITMLEAKIKEKRPVEKELKEIARIEEEIKNLKIKIEEEIENVKKPHARVDALKKHFNEKHNTLISLLEDVKQNRNITKISEIKNLTNTKQYEPKSKPSGELGLHICPINRAPKIIPEPKLKRSGYREDSQPTPEDTMETPEIQFTPKIEALACSLEHDPRRIYDFVRNQVHYQPYFGVTRSAQSVLMEKAGNDFDQSTLLIALLRVSKIPSRYAYGIIDLPISNLLNLLRVDSLSAALSVLTSAGIPYQIVANGTRVWLKHCFVKSYVPISFYRGEIRDEQGKAWISFAPAYKCCEITPGFDVVTEMDFDVLEFFEDYIKNGRTTNPMLLYRQKINDYLASHHPGLDYETVKRKTNITIEEFPILPFTTQPYLYHVYDEFSAVPDSFRHHVRITVFDEYGLTCIDTLLYLSQFTGRRTTLFYCGASAVDSMWIEEYGGMFDVPPYLLNLLPTLAIDGEIVKIGDQDVKMGMVHTLRIELINEQGNKEILNRDLIAGAIHALGMGVYSVGVPSMFDILPTDTLGCDTWIGKAVSDAVKRFFNTYDVSINELGSTNQAIIVRDNVFLGCATSHRVEYLYGAPYTFEWKGYEFLPGLLRLGTNFVDGLNIQERNSRLRFLSGMCWSYSANQALLAATGAEAIDPLVLLTLADSTMIPVYKITPEGIEPLEEPGGRGASLIPFPNKTIKENTRPSFTTKPNEKYVPQELIVKFKTGSFEQNRKQISLLSEAQIIKTSRRNNVFLIKIPKSQNLQSAIANLQSHPLIEYASSNYYVFALVLPNDPQYTAQWHLHRVAAKDGWDITTGDSSIVLAILDTGLDSDHAEFISKIFPGYDFVNDDPEPYDDNGHGTHVSGIAAAATNNSIGIAGVDWQTKIMPLKVLNEQGTGTAFNVCEGIYWAADFGAKVINLSLGSYSYSPSYVDAINYARALGCMVIAAAGNDNTDDPVYPGSLDNVICVAATNQHDEKAAFSNYGTYIDLSAPGVSILSTLPRNQYTYYNGTSMATPLVSGLATLLFAANPLYTPVEIESLLMTYADDLGEPNWDEYFGYGRVNVFKSLFGPAPVVLGYYGSCILGDGVATAGETFNMTISILNSGDSTAYAVRASLSTNDPYVIIDQNFSRYGDIPRNDVVIGIDNFVVRFKSFMPKNHKVWFYLTIEDSLGIIYTDGFMIKEGEYLPGFIAPDPMKDLIRGYINQGYAAYLPQGNLMYKDFLGTGFASHDLEKLDGTGNSAWYTFEEWWERFGASCVHVFITYWPNISNLIGETYNDEPVYRIDVRYVEVEVLDPENNAAFPIGDTIGIIEDHEADVDIRTQVIVDYDTLGNPIYEYHDYQAEVGWIDTLIWNTSEPPNLGGEWIPTSYQFWPAEYNWLYGFIWPENETRIWWLFIFNIRENLVKKYFNPLKPDSARIVYEILPLQYADPDVLPNPKAFSVEITDKDGTPVRSWNLTPQEQKSQVLFWDGRDNQGELANPTGSPFEVALKLTYQSSGRIEKNKIVKTDVNSRVISIVAFIVEDDVQILDEDMQTPIYDPIFARHYDENTGQLIVDRELKSFGDKILKEENNYTMQFKLKYIMDAYPSKDVYGEPKLKYEFKLTDPGGAANVAAVITGEKVGWEGIIEYNKEVALPNHEDFALHLWTLSANYIYPKEGAQIIDKEIFTQNLKVFFEKGTGPIVWEGDYDGDLEPNWFEYWRRLSYLQGPPYDALLSKYDKVLFFPIVGRYTPKEDAQRYFIGTAAGSKGTIYDHDFEGIGELAGIHLFAEDCRHEDLHRVHFTTWWIDWEKYWDVWETKDIDGDWIPNSLEPLFGLDSLKRNTDGDELLDTDEIVFCYHHDWFIEIKTDLNFSINDWATPGKQTYPQF